MRCLYCGCSEFDACILDNGVPCSWKSTDPPVCSSPECVDAHRERAATRPSSPQVTAFRFCADPRCYCIDNVIDNACASLSRATPAGPTPCPSCGGVGQIMDADCCAWGCRHCNGGGWILTGAPAVEPPVSGATPVAGQL